METERMSAPILTLDDLADRIADDRGDG